MITITRHAMGSATKGAAWAAALALSQFINRRRTKGNQPND